MSSISVSHHYSVHDCRHGLGGGAGGSYPTDLQQGIYLADICVYSDHDQGKEEDG